MNSKRVIYTSFQPYTFELAKQLHKDLEWEPVFWNVVDGFEQEVKASFPDVITHNINDAIKGKLPSGFDENELEPLDSKILTDLSFHESIVLNMMNRDYLFDPLSYQERLRLYHRLLRFYLTIFKKLKPDYLILEDTPHEPSNYIMYVLAHKMGIKTILCESIISSNYFLPMEKFEEGNKKFMEAYFKVCSNLDDNHTETEEEINLQIEKFKGNFNHLVQSYMIKQKGDFIKKNNKTIQKFKHNILLFLKTFNVSKFQKRFKFILSLNKTSENNFYKQKDKKMEDSNISNFEFLKSVRKIKKIKEDNLRYYKSNQNETPDFDLPFVFCALHFQPEKTSSPWGGHFVNQFLIVDMLSKTIPHGWKIYVKDHVAQYINPENGEPLRNKTFYDDIIKLHNVELIPMKCSSFDIIEKAQAVASIAGSILWESVLRGKPALAFGAGHHCLYGGCEGVFYTPNTELLTNAIDKIKNGYKVNLQKVVLYGNLIEKLAYKGYVGGVTQAKNSGLTPEENGRIHAQAIKDLINQEETANNIYVNQTL